MKKTSKYEEFLEAVETLRTSVEGSAEFLKVYRNFYEITTAAMPELLNKLYISCIGIKNSKDYLIIFTGKNDYHFSFEFKTSSEKVQKLNNKRDELLSPVLRELIESRNITAEQALEYKLKINEITDYLQIEERQVFFDEEMESNYFKIQFGNALFNDIMKSRKITQEKDNELKNNLRALAAKGFLK